MFFFLWLFEARSCGCCRTDKQPTVIMNIDFGVRTCPSGKKERGVEKEQQIHVSLHECIN